MSHRISQFDGNGWHVFEHGMRSDPGLYVSGDYFAGRPESDCEYPNLEVGTSEMQTEFCVFIPLEVARAIAKWVAEADAAKPGWSAESQAAWRKP